MNIKSLTVILATAMLAALPITAAQYKWVGGFAATPHSWQASQNWSPERLTPSATDSLIFRTGRTDTVTNVPTTAVRFLFVDSMTQLVLSPGTNGDTLTIGKFMQVNGLCSFTVATASDQMVIRVPAGAGVTTMGTMTFHADSLNSCHRFEAADKNCIVFVPGSRFIQECGGTVFGNTGQDSVARFDANSKFINRKWGEPFGFAPGTNRSKVWWWPGSRYVHQTTTGLSLPGRRYTDFEFDAGSGNITANNSTNTLPFVADSLIVTSGELRCNGTTPVTFNGNVRVESGAALTFFPWAPFDWSFTGSGDQAIKGGGYINPQPGTRLVVNKPSGDLQLARNLQVMDTITLTKGRVNTGAYTFYNSMAIPVIYSNDSSYVIGNLKVTVPLGMSNQILPIGTANGRSPAQFSISGVVTADMTITAMAHQAVHPSVLVPAQALQRYWSISSPMVQGVDFSFCEAFFYYRSEDFTTEFTEVANEATMITGRYAGAAWSYPAVGYYYPAGPGGRVSLSTGVLNADFTFAQDLSSFSGVCGQPQSPAPIGDFSLRAYPNPSHGPVVFKFQLPKTSQVELSLYNVAGQLVKTFSEGTKPAGYHQINWHNGSLSNGIYFYKLRAGEFTATKKLVVLK